MYKDIITCYLISRLSFINLRVKILRKLSSIGLYFGAGETLNFPFNFVTYAPWYWIPMKCFKNEIWNKKCTYTYYAHIIVTPPINQSHIISQELCHCIFFKISVTIPTSFLLTTFTIIANIFDKGHLKRFK